MARTGKSCLINATPSEKCVVTAKASYNINGKTIHSFFKFPVTSNSHTDLSGKSLVQLQEKVLNVDYIMIDEYSMPGQSMFRWINAKET